MLQNPPQMLLTNSFQIMSSVILVVDVHDGITKGQVTK